MLTHWKDAICLTMAYILDLQHLLHPLSLLLDVILWINPFGVFKNNAIFSIISPLGIERQGIYRNV